MISKNKIEKIFTIVENLRKSADGNKRLLNCVSIIELLLNNIDDIQEELEHLIEENEALRFDLEDKKIEQGPRRRTNAEI
ncbi:MAG: hypothetical protein KQ78_00027 [Candidatus Izimaplasma bacterium HR2]|nr:MAG: hypothetical protein KQ78_00027 [Candidatus Izimaplasma bacterium HR2]